MPASGVQFVFIVGVSGSGTTLLARILSAPPGAVCLGGNYISIADEEHEALALAQAFNDATQVLWDRHAAAAAALAAKRRAVEAVRGLTAVPAYRNLTHLIYKRSAPFMTGDRYRPCLHDLPDMFGNARILAIHRDPRASTVSSLRREFGSNLRQCAIVTEEQLTLLSAQIAAMNDGRTLCFAYEDFCADTASLCRRIAEFCGLSADRLIEAADAAAVEPGRNHRWRQDLAPSEIEFLDGFFSVARRRQWPMLPGPSG